VASNDAMRWGMGARNFRRASDQNLKFQSYMAWPNRQLRAGRTCGSWLRPTGENDPSISSAVAGELPLVAPCRARTAAPDSSEIFVRSLLGPADDLHYDRYALLTRLGFAHIRAGLGSDDSQRPARAI